MTRISQAPVKGRSYIKSHFQIFKIRLSARRWPTLCGSRAKPSDQSLLALSRTKKNCKICSERRIRLRRWSRPGIKRSRCTSTWVGKSKTWVNGLRNMKRLWPSSTQPSLRGLPHLSFKNWTIVKVRSQPSLRLTRTITSLKLLTMTSSRIMQNKSSSAQLRIGLFSQCLKNDWRQHTILTSSWESSSRS